MHVFAVVVCYNSASVITNLLNKLLAQTVAFSKIIIVDNNSIDQTINKVLELNNNKLEIIQLKENLGGAGGFCAGIMRALELNADAVVTFDDDALPTNHFFLEKIVDYQQKYKLDVISPLVVDTQDCKKTAYEYRLGSKRTHRVEEVKQWTLPILDIKLFNGVFFTKSVVKKIGYPDTKFFLRGDEEEYRQRIYKSDFNIRVLPDVQVLHPSSVHEYYYHKKKRYHHPSELHKLYYSTRNRMHIIWYHSNLPPSKRIKRVVSEFKKYTYFYCVVRKLDIEVYGVWLRAMKAGLKKPSHLEKDRY